MSAADKPTIDPEVARFAAALKEQAKLDEAQRRQAAATREAAAAEEAARQAAAEAARAEERRRADLQRAKDAAAASLKEARRSGRGVAEAEGAYRAALAALVADETGARPGWAPDEPASEPEAVVDAGGAEAGQPGDGDEVDGSGEPEAAEAAAGGDA